MMQYRRHAAKSFWLKAVSMRCQTLARRGICCACSLIWGPCNRVAWGLRLWTTYNCKLGSNAMGQGFHLGRLNSCGGCLVSTSVSSSAQKSRMLQRLAAWMKPQSSSMTGASVSARGLVLDCALLLKRCGADIGRASV